MNEFDNSSSTRLISDRRGLNLPPHPYPRPNPSSSSLTTSSHITRGITTGIGEIRNLLIEDITSTTSRCLIRHCDPIKTLEGSRSVRIRLIP